MSGTRPIRLAFRQARAPGSTVGALVVVAILAWLCFHGKAPPLPASEHGDYFNLLVDGLLKGHTYLDLPVPAELAALESPWNPAQRPDSIPVPADISYRDGRYFLYFGITPVVVLFLPFRLLTGVDLPMQVAVFLFAGSSVFLLGAVWQRLLQWYAPASAAWLLPAGTLVCGLGGGLVPVVVRSSVWELPIAASQCFVAAFVLAVLNASRGLRCTRALAAAGVFLGCAVGARPTMVLLVPLLLLVAFRSSGGTSVGAHKPGCRWRRILAAGIPLAVIGLLLAAYNTVRFGNPAEFGLNYQLTSRHEAAAQHFSLGYVPYNLLAYFGTAPKAATLFPFISAGSLPESPTGYYIAEYPFGSLYLAPVLWFTLLVPVLAMTGPRTSQFNRGLLPLAGVAAITTSILLCFDTATPRYTADFLPWWLLLGLVGFAVLGSRLTSAWMRRAMDCIFGIAAAATCILALFAGFTYYGILEFNNPRHYAVIARAFNLPIAWYEALNRTPRGGVELTLRFPPYAGGVTEEPLLRLGRDTGDHAELWVRYEEASRARLVYRRSDLPALESQPFRFVSDAEATLHIESGALLPSDYHPALADLTPVESRWHRRWVTVRLNGELLLDAVQPEGRVDAGAVEVGADAGVPQGQEFTGTILGVRRTGIPRSLRSARQVADVRLEMNPPRFTAPYSPVPEIEVPQPGMPHPLVGTGRAGRSDLVTLRRIDETHVEFAYERWGAGRFTSEPVPIPPEAAVVVQVRLGSLLDLSEGSPLAVLRNTLAIWLGDRPVWWQRLAEPLSAAEPDFLAWNPLRSNAAAEQFHGRIGRWSGALRLAPWKSGSFPGVRLLVGGRGTGVDPLLAVGQAGKANTLAIRWVGEDRVVLVYDHWGYGMYESNAVEWRAGQARQVDIRWSALDLLDRGESGAIASGQLEVWLDGASIWKRDVPFYVSASATVALGKNRAGSSICAPEMSAVMLDIAQWDGSPGDANR